MFPRRNRILICAALLTVVIAAAYVLFNDIPTAEAQRDAASLSVRERDLLSELRKLLEPHSITTNESKTIDSNNALFRTALLRIQSTSKDGLSHTPSATAELSVVDISTNAARKPTMRSIELSPHTIFAAMIDENSDLVSWGVYPDPRIFRTESSTLDGKLEGSLMYRASAELLLPVPTQNSPMTVRLFYPNWDGREYNLEPIGSVSIR